MAGCSALDKLAKDTTKLERGPGKIAERRLRLTIKGGSDELRANLASAFRSELEDGDLFHVVEPPESRRRPRTGELQLDLDNVDERTFGNWYVEEQGWIVKYEVKATLIDQRGREVLKGQLCGVAFDDALIKDRELTKEKHEDMRRAAQRDVAVKMSNALRAIVAREIDDERRAIRALRLAPGVAPLKLALVSVDLKRAHPAIQATAIEGELLSALARGGPDLEILTPQRIRVAKERQNIGEIVGLTVPKEIAKNLERALPARLIVLVTVRSQEDGVVMDGALYELQNGARLLGEGRARALGVGALRLASVRLAKELLARIAEARFQAISEK